MSTYCKHQMDQCLSNIFLKILKIKISILSAATMAPLKPPHMDVITSLITHPTPPASFSYGPMSPNLSKLPSNLTIITNLMTAMSHEIPIQIIKPESDQSRNLRWMRTRGSNASNPSTFECNHYNTDIQHWVPWNLIITPSSPAISKAQPYPF